MYEKGHIWEQSWEGKSVKIGIRQKNEGPVLAFCNPTVFLHFIFYARFVFQNDFEGIPSKGQSPAGWVESWSSVLDSYPVIEIAKVARVEAAMEITCPGNSAPIKQACI